MVIKRAFFLINSIWELIRFFLLFTALILTFQLVILIDRQSIFWLIIFGSSHLLLPVGLLFLYIDPKKFFSLLNLIKLGKILAIFSSILLIILEPIGSGLHFVWLNFLPFHIKPVAMLLGITFLDLIFLFVLISYRVLDDEHKDIDILPDFKEIELTDPKDEK